METKTRTKENVKEGLEMSATVPCPLCGEEVPVQLDKNNMPYLTCSDCKIQLFVRGRQGAENLEDIIHNKREWGEKS